MRLGLLFLACAAASTAAVAANVKKLKFSADDPEALVIVEERDGMRGGSLTFIAVDLDAMARSGGKIVVDKTTRGRLRTEDPGLQTKGEGLLIPKNMSRFSAAKGAAGHYALIDFSYYNGLRGVSNCPKEGAPVFRFDAGKANLVNAEALPEGGGSTNILAYAAARNGSNDDLGDAQKVINEYAALRSQVVAAPLVGFVKFDNGKGKQSACSSAKKLVLVSKAAD